MIGLSGDDAAAVWLDEPAGWAEWCAAAALAIVHLVDWQSRTRRLQSANSQRTCQSAPSAIAATTQHTPTDQHALTGIPTHCSRQSGCLVFQLIVVSREQQHSQ